MSEDKPKGNHAMDNPACQECGGVEHVRNVAEWAGLEIFICEECIEMARRRNKALLQAALDTHRST